MKQLEAEYSRASQELSFRKLEAKRERERRKALRVVDAMLPRLRPCDVDVIRWAAAFPKSARCNGSVGGMRCAMPADCTPLYCAACDLRRRRNGS